MGDQWINSNESINMFGIKEKNKQFPCGVGVRMYKMWVNRVTPVAKGNVNILHKISLEGV